MKSYFFNADYEERLFSTSPEKIESNKKTQFLEFLGWFLGYETIYTNKKYSEDYLKFVEDICGFKPKITIESARLERIWGKVSPLEVMRKLNSKETSYKLSKRLNLTQEPSELKKSPFFLGEGEIAKSFYSFSGRGHLSSPQEVLSAGEYIVEKKLNRVLDFSTLCFKDKNIYYQNSVDKNFQYQGTILREKDDLDFLDDKIKNAYISDIQKIRSEYDYGLDFDESYTIDSFIYEKNKTQFLYSLCEVNFRMTMGKVAYLLREKYLKNFSYHYLGFTKKIKDKRINENAIILSPDDNLKHLIFLGAHSMDELEKLRIYFCM